MSARFQPRVLGAVALLSVLVAAANNLWLAAPRLAWLGSPAVLDTPLDLEREPHLAGALKGVRFALHELQHGAFGIALAALLVCVAGLLWWRLGKARPALVLEAIFRLGMSAMFLLACWYKLKNPGDFASAVAQYRMLPAPLVNGFALLMPAAEFTVAVGLLVTPFTRELYLAMTLLWLMFIVALGQALARRLGITCGCFALADIAGSVGETWFSLLRDLVLIVPTAWLAFRAENRFIWQRR